MAAAPVVPEPAAGHMYICAECPRMPRPEAAAPEEAAAAAVVRLPAVAVPVVVVAAAAVAKYGAAVVRRWAAAAAAVVLAAAGGVAGVAAVDSRGCALLARLPQPPCIEAGDEAPTRAYTCRPSMPWYVEYASSGGRRAPCRG